MSTSTEIASALEDTLILAARKDNLHVFWAPNDRGLWTSPNASTLPLPVPDVEQHEGFYRRYFRNPQKIRWMSNFDAFLGFWPLHHPWTGPFACLEFPVNRVPLQHDQIWHRIDQGKSYFLSPPIIYSWRALEDDLVQLSTGLVRRNIRAQHEWQDIRAPTLPHVCGYQKLYSDADIAAKNIRVSRNAFVILSCFVSFAIALDMAKNPGSSEMAPSWLTYAVEELGMDPAWLSALNGTFVCNFSRGFRPGSFVPAHRGGFGETYEAFIAGNVPLYICWGPNPPTWMTENDYRWRYRPSKAEAKRAINMFYHCLASETGPPITDPRVSQEDSWFNPHAKEADSIQESPESPPADMQQDNEPQTSHETPTQFLERMFLERERIMAGESESAARHRLEEEMWAEEVRIGDQMRVRSGRESFVVWTEVEEDTFVTHYVNESEWETVWSKTSPQQRCYIYDYCEWHLVPKGTIDPDDAPIHEKQRSTSPQSDEPLPECPGTYAPYDIDPSDESDDEEDTSRRKRKRGKGKQAAPIPNKKGAPNQSADNRDIYLNPASSSTVPQSAKPSPLQPPPVTIVITENGIETLRRRYMFLASKPYVADHRAAGKKRLKDKEEGEIDPAPSTGAVLTQLGLKSTFPSPDTTRAAMDFYDFVFASPAKKLFSPVWGFVPTDSHNITNHAYFHYRRLREDLHVIGVRGDISLDRQWYLLAIPDARAVVELFRQKDLESISAMVRYLVTHGIPFFTGKPVQSLPRPNPTTRLTLEYRPTAYQFQPADFADYDKKKIDFLAGSAGRAAVTRGGIVWRLSREHIDIKRITRGPTSSAAARGVFISNLDNGYLVDDTLTQEDEDMICGTYTVYTRTFFVLFS